MGQHSRCCNCFKNDMPKLNPTKKKKIAVKKTTREAMMSKKKFWHSCSTRELEFLVVVSNSGNNATTELMPFEEGSSSNEDGERTNQPAGKTFVATFQNFQIFQCLPLKCLQVLQIVKWICVCFHHFGICRKKKNAWRFGVS